MKKEWSYSEIKELEIENGFGPVTDAGSLPDDSDPA